MSAGGPTGGVVTSLAISGAGLSLNGTGPSGALSISLLSLVTSMIFGDGSDLAGLNPTSPLTRDWYFTDLQIDAGHTLNTGGCRVFVKGTLTLNGVIQNNGANGTDGLVAGIGTGGVAATAATIGGGSQNGGNGSNTIGVGSGTNLGQVPTSFRPGAGGAGGAGAGGAGGPVTAFSFFTDANGSINNLYSAQSGRVLGNNGVFWGGSGGGGGGGSGAGPCGGGGGGGGGVVIVSASKITGSGVINSLGGNGGNGYQVSGNTGGGGGGGGGYIIVVTAGGVFPTTNAAGGTGGAKRGTGVAGVNGNAGQAIFLGN